MVFPPAVFGTMGSVESETVWDCPAGDRVWRGQVVAVGDGWAFRLLRNDTLVMSWRFTTFDEALREAAEQRLMCRGRGCDYETSAPVNGNGG
jgi:hypothetical protein